MFWHETAKQLALTGLLSSLIQHTVLVDKSGSTWTVATDSDRYSQWTAPRVYELQQRLQQLSGQSIVVKMQDGVPCEAQTPAMIENEIKARKLADARASLQNDPVFRELIASTNASVIEESLRSLH